MLGLSTLVDVATAYFFTRPLVILLGRNRDHRQRAATSASPAASPPSSRPHEPRAHPPGLGGAAARTGLDDAAPLPAAVRPTDRGVHPRFPPPLRPTSRPRAVAPPTSRQAAPQPAPGPAAAAAPGRQKKAHGPFRRLYFGETRFDFVRRRQMVVRALLRRHPVGRHLARDAGLNLDIEFAGGNAWIVQTSKVPISVTAARSASRRYGLGGATITQLGTPPKRPSRSRRSCQRVRRRSSRTRSKRT